MDRATLEHEMTREELQVCAHHTCQWWNAVFVQARRFCEEFDNQQGVEPWTDEGAKRIFVPERMFLITAIFHAIEGLRKLDIELRRGNDDTFQDVLHRVFAVVSWDDIKELRHMNEHSLSYLVNEGHDQNKFVRTYANNEKEIQLPAVWTFLNGDMDMFLLGNVPIDKLLSIMKEQTPKVKKKLEEICY